MQAIKVDLPRDLAFAKIYILADLHIGDKACDMQHIKRVIEEIAAERNAFCILNGDLINNGTKNSVSDIYSEQCNPMKQIKTVSELLSPIREKIICITPGNHEKRTWKTEGISITNIMAMELGLRDKLVDGAAVLFIRLGENSRKIKETGNMNAYRPICYSIYCLHGSGGGRREGSKVNRLAEMAGIIDVDVYIHSHTHLPVVMKQAFYRSDTRNSSFHIAEKLFVNTAASLNYGGYGEAAEFKPASKATPVIFLNGKKKEATAII